MKKIDYKNYCSWSTNFRDSASHQLGKMAVGVLFPQIKHPNNNNNVLTGKEKQVT